MGWAIVWQHPYYILLIGEMHVPASCSSYILRVTGVYPAPYILSSRPLIIVVVYTITRYRQLQFACISMMKFHNQDQESPPFVVERFLILVVKGLASMGVSQDTMRRQGCECFCMGE